MGGLRFGRVAPPSATLAVCTVALQQSRAPIPRRSTGIEFSPHDTSHANVFRAADTVARLLFRIREGRILHEDIRREASDWLSGSKAEALLSQPDTHVIGQRFSPPRVTFPSRYRPRSTSPGSITMISRR